MRTKGYEKIVHDVAEMDALKQKLLDGIRENWEVSVRMEQEYLESYDFLLKSKTEL